ncbi:MAG: hypothetical protein ABEJ23_09535 [Haloarculaceae archaeon]
MPPEHRHQLMSDDPDRQTEMRRALRQVRREGYKLAVLYATLDGVGVVLLVALVLGLADPAPLDAVPYGDGAVAVLCGLAAAGVEGAVRVRRPLVEQFEAANPGVRESLRTARDAVAADADSTMALALYRDVLASLRESSSVDLVDVRRVVGTLAVVFLLSVAVVQATLVGLDLGGPPPADGGTGGGGGGRGVDDPYGGLADGEQVLGDPENVSSGSADLGVNLSQGRGEGPGPSDRAYDTGGFGGGDASVDAQRAGYASEDRLADADIIREYNLAIREEEDT